MPSEIGSEKTCPKCGTRSPNANDHCKKCYWPLDANTQSDD